MIKCGKITKKSNNLSLIISPLQKCWDPIGISGIARKSMGSHMVSSGYTKPHHGGIIGTQLNIMKFPRFQRGTEIFHGEPMPIRNSLIA